MINFFHVYIKRRPDHLEPAIELNISESDLKKNIVNTCRGYPVVSFGCGGFLINGYQDISEITIFKTNIEVEQSSSKIKDDWNTLQKKGENVTKLFIEYDHIPWSDVMQVCLNGHIINTSYSKYPDNNEDYCSQCGAETIIGCSKCKKKFRGDQYRPTYEKKGQIKNFC